MDLQVNMVYDVSMIFQIDCDTIRNISLSGWQSVSNLSILIMSGGIRMKMSAVSAIANRVKMPITMRRAASRSPISR